MNLVHCKIYPWLICVGGLAIQPLTAFSQVPSIPVIHLVNQANQDLYDALTAKTTFVTDFKGSNDVTITRLAGSVGQDFVDSFGGAYSHGNPAYLTNFLGTLTNGTGDDIVGDIECIQTDADHFPSLQFDFALGFTPNDRLLVIDCDNSEQYRIQAYVKSGNTYNPVSPTNWGVSDYEGSTQDPNLGSFPVWSPSTGSLTGSGDALNEPLTIFTPNQTVDRVVVTQTATTGTADIQFVQATQVSLGLLGISRQTTNVLINIPGGSVVPALETTTNLNNAVWKILITNATPGVLTVPISTNRQQFFRLRY